MVCQGATKPVNRGFGQGGGLLNVRYAYGSPRNSDDFKDCNESFKMQCFLIIQDLLSNYDKRLAPKQDKIAEE